MRRFAAAAALVLVLSAPAFAQGFTMRLSGDIIIPRDTVHDGSAMTMNGRIQVDGTLRGDAMTMNGDITVGGTVTGSVRTFNGNIVLTSTAVVGGDVWSANGRIDRGPGAQVRGRIQGSAVGPRGPSVQVPPPAPVPPSGPMRSRPWSGPWSPWWPGMMRAMATWTLISFVALAAVLAALFPVQIRRVADALHHSPGESLLAGFALWVMLPLLSVVLALSIVGIPVLVFLPFGVMLIGLVGFAGASQLIGDRLLGGFQQQHSTALEAVVGAAILGVLAFIPGLGWLAILVGVTWGVGGVLLLILRRLRPAPPPAATPS